MRSFVCLELSLFERLKHSGRMKYVTDHLQMANIVMATPESTSNAPIVDAFIPSSGTLSMVDVFVVKFVVKFVVMFVVSGSDGVEKTAGEMTGGECGGDTRREFDGGGGKGGLLGGSVGGKMQ